jgi:hypothetical protein
MTVKKIPTLLNHWAWSAIMAGAFLSACGGGGGSGASMPTGNSDTFAAVVNGGSASATGIEGTAEPLKISAALSYSGTGNLYLAAEVDRAVALGVQGQLSGNSLALIITLRGDLSAGTYANELLLHACLDDKCAAEAAGSPVHFPIRYEVKPGIGVQPQVGLSRTGADPAPSVTLPVTAPAAAGTVTLLSTNSSNNAIALSFDGRALSIQTTQVPAGVYTATATLQSSTDVRYSRNVLIDYTVGPPLGGEHPLAVDNALRSVVLQQGTSATQHLTLTRPTWTNVLDAPQILGDANHLLTLVDLGNDKYDVTISAAGVPLGGYSPSVRFSAGPTGGVVFVGFSVNVSGVVYLGGDLDPTLTAASTTADLNWSNPVLTFDGVQANWTAVSMSPLLHLVRASGRTGVDALQVALDPAALVGNDTGFAPVVQLTIDRPGTSHVPIQYSVHNEIPTLQRVSPQTLVGSGGRIYIEGAFAQYRSGLTDGTHLHVTGANVTAAQILADTRFVGDVLVLAVDVTGASPGTPVTLSVDSSLLPTQASLRVVAPFRAAASFQTLPFASYRPAQFAPGLNSLYFSAPGTAYRWAYDGSAWVLSQASIAGLIDVAPAPDDSALYVSNAEHVIALDPTTFVQRSIGSLLGAPASTTDFDATAMAGARALVFSADDRALASISDRNFTISRGSGWICSQQTGRLVRELTTAPGPCDPGIQKSPEAGTTFGTGLVRSANGYFVESVGPLGERLIYRAAQRAWVYAGKLSSGLTFVAAADTGLRIVRSDGMLLDGNDKELGNLGSVLPFTHVAAGYGLSSGGRFGLVYGYRVTGTGAGQRATEAMVWVIDLNTVSTTGIATAPVIAAIALPQAVGCTDVLAAGETCQHNASISVAPGDGTAFVLGPRGVATVPLPVAVTPMTPSATSVLPAAQGGAKLRTSVFGR